MYKIIWSEIVIITIMVDIKLENNRLGPHEKIDKIWVNYINTIKLIDWYINLIFINR